MAETENNYETGVIHKRHPITGEPGQWRLFPNLGTYVNLDPNPPKDLYWNQRGQNYLGELGQYYTVNPNTGEESIVTDPETGETRGGWYYSGTMGWVNTKPAPADQQSSVGWFLQPVDREATYGSENTGSSDTTSTNTGANTSGGNGASTDAPASTSQTTTDSTSMASMGGATSGYAPSTPMTLGYQLPSLSSISATGGVDYVKMLNSALAADVMSGMLTGRGRIV